MKVFVLVGFSVEDGDVMAVDVYPTHDQAHIRMLSFAWNEMQDTYEGIPDDVETDEQLVKFINDGAGWFDDDSFSHDEVATQYRIYEREV